MEKQIILCIDPGEKQSGIVIFENGVLVKGAIWENEALFSYLDESTLFNEGSIDLTVVYEDIRPYASRFNMNTINTIKMIGRLEYVLSARLVTLVPITRNEVKNYVFTKFYDLVVDGINKKIEKLKRVRKNGEAYKPSFHYIDDRLVQKAIAFRYEQKKPKPGKTNPLGLRSHAWQALGVAGVFWDIKLNTQSVQDAV